MSKTLFILLETTIVSMSSELSLITLVAIILGLFIGAGITLIVTSILIRRSNNLGDVLPTLSDYSTDTFGSSFFGKDYGKTKGKKIYDFPNNSIENP